MVATRYTFTSQHIRELLGVLQAAAPNGDAQQICTQLVQDMQRDGVELHQQIRVLAGEVYNGLTTGNWPWEYPRIVDGPDGKGKVTTVPYLVKGGQTEVDV